MKPRQISVFVENRTGRVAEVTRILGEGGINIRAASLADTHDFGIVRLIVDRVDEALTLLRSKQFTALDTEVVAVEIADEPGSLAKVLAILDQDNVNVEYLYGFTERGAQKAILIFRFENTNQAVEALERNRIQILSGEELGRL